MRLVGEVRILSKERCQALGKMSELGQQRKSGRGHMKFRSQV